jgi:hypothetical protein
MRLNKRTSVNSIESGGVMATFIGWGNAPETIEYEGRTLGFERYIGRTGERKGPLGIFKIIDAYYS